MNNIKLNFISGLSREKQKFVITLDIEANKVFCTLDNSIVCPETIEVLDSAILNSSTLTNQQFITISKADLKDYDYLYIESPDYPDRYYFQGNLYVSRLMKRPTTNKYLARFKK